MSRTTGFGPLESGALRLAEGFTIDGIARRLGISRNTVRTHVAMLREKLGVSSALAAAAEMRRAVTPFA